MFRLEQVCQGNDSPTSLCVAIRVRHAICKTYLILAFAVQRVAKSRMEKLGGQDLVVIYTGGNGNDVRLFSRTRAGSVWFAADGSFLIGVEA